MLISRLILLPLGFAAAESGIDAWLRYARVPKARCYQAAVPDTVVALNSTTVSPVYTAGQELQKGIKGMVGEDVSVQHKAAGGRSIIVGTVAAYTESGGNTKDHPKLAGLIKDGYYLSIAGTNTLILGQNERGALYGAFRYLELIGQGKLSSMLSIASNPDVPIRWVNQWDNMQDGGTHGSIERGYAGNSIFFWAGRIRQDLTRVSQYGRILASIGINAVVINNVNANVNLLNNTNLDGVARIADAFRPWGIQVGMSLFFASPRDLGGLPTFDPLDKTVIKWWGDKTNDIYKRVPDFAGYLVKANSEGQPGPLTYNRTLAQGANLFAHALKPHGGTIMFRAFVYDHTTLNQDLDWKADRASAAVQFFQGLDDKFEDNVVIQIKYGPIDFQVREPVSPLFTHLRKTPSVVEFQITQEYLGQQAHLVYIPPMWKELLDFDLRVDSKPSPLKSILNGKVFGRPGGYAGVVNVGLNETWLGSHLSMSNLYAYGKMAWDPESDPDALLRTWTKLTFSHDPAVVDTISDMSMESWPAYENYTGNLGVQTLTDILNAHYGPNPASQDNNPWGQWTRADADSIGMDRTVWNGTRFSGQYPAEVAARYEKIETTPDNLLLWFHHVPYTQRLKGGKTVIQHFYDAHYDGAAVAQTFPTRWESLKGKMDDRQYDEQLSRLVYQAGHALVWRDSVCNFYFNKSSIPDDRGRVGNYKYRIEAENMVLDGYLPYRVQPFESASRGWAIVTRTNTTKGSATTWLRNVESGRYDVAVNYYDQAVGRAAWELFVGDRLVGSWKGDMEYRIGKAPTFYIDGQAAVRITFKGVDVTKGDMLRIVGTPDGREPAPIDYVSILPEGVVD
ncbi:hypothetical protein RB597_002283 [Gaeumannomyces tritici]